MEKNGQGRNWVGEKKLRNRYEEACKERGVENPSAFVKALYRCEKCKHKEWIWNSRDGVTPFIVGCVKCGGSAQHEAWHLDKYLPDYVPELGERVFVTMLEASAKRYARKRIEYMRKDPGERSIPKIGSSAYDQLLRELAADLGRDAETPDLIVVKKVVDGKVVQTE